MNPAASPASPPRATRKRRHCAPPGRRLPVLAVLAGFGVVAATGCGASPAPATPPPARVAPTPAPTASSAPPRGEPAGSLDRRDPASVARRYIQLRWTYTWTDPPGLVAAWAARTVTTAAFAARSVPSSPAVERVEQAQDAVGVTVTAAGVDGEMPATPMSRYVDVAFTRTETFRGSTGPHPDSTLWQLRLVVSPDGWRVDGVENGQ